MSKRKIDQNGYLEISDNPLTKVGVFPYLASEIGATDRDPKEVVRVYRSVEELEKAADSFKLMPFINDHEWLGNTGTPSEKKGVLGVIGEQIKFQHPHLLGNIKIHSSIAQDLINSGKVELSAGYKCDYEPASGTFDGQQYDYIQRNIRCNHLALVQEGRSGKDVSIQDHSIITIDTAELLPMTIEEILAALADLSDEDKAKLLAALAPAEDEQQVEEKTEDEPETTTEEVAELAAEAGEAVIEVAEAAQEATETEDSIAALKAEIAALKSKTMDSAAIMKMIADRDSLAKRLQPHVGTFDHSAMTTQQVAEYGVSKLGIKCDKRQAIVALDAALQVRVADSNKPTLDSKAAVKGNLKAFGWEK